MSVSDASPPTLSYATPRGLTEKLELDQYVQNLIAAGAGPRNIRRYFRRDRDAIGYFCETMSRLRAKDSKENRCVDCGAEEDGRRIQLRWRVELKTYTLDVPLTRPPGQALATWHPICVTCESAWRRNLRWDRMRRWLIIAVAVVVAGNVIGLVARGTLALRRAGSEWAPLLYFIALITTLIVARLAVGFAIRSLRPKRLHRLMPEGVRYIELGPTQLQENMHGTV